MNTKVAALQRITENIARDLIKPKHSDCFSSTCLRGTIASCARWYEYIKRWIFFTTEDLYQSLQYYLRCMQTQYFELMEWFDLIVELLLILHISRVVTLEIRFYIIPHPMNSRLHNLIYFASCDWLFYAIIIIRVTWKPNRCAKWTVCLHRKMHHCGGRAAV